MNLFNFNAIKIIPKSLILDTRKIVNHLQLAFIKALIY